MVSLKKRRKRRKRSEIPYKTQRHQAGTILNIHSKLSVKGKFKEYATFILFLHLFRLLLPAIQINHMTFIILTPPPSSTLLPNLSSQPLRPKHLTTLVRARALIILIRPIKFQQSPFQQPFTIPHHVPILTHLDMEVRKHKPLARHLVVRDCPDLRGARVRVDDGGWIDVEFLFLLSVG